MTRPENQPENQHGQITTDEEVPAPGASCPVIHDQLPRPTQGDANSIWWPNRLNLDFLATNPPAKDPYGDGFDRVARATTLPILLLGGPARESPLHTLDDFARGMAAGANVRGAIIGRNLLFPGDGDPLPMCRALTRIVHHGASLDEAAQVLAEEPRRPRRAARKKK